MPPHKTAENTLGQVNVITAGASRTILPLLRLNRDGHCRTNSLAKLACNTTLLSIRVTTESMQTPKPRTLRRFLLRKLDVIFLAKKCRPVRAIPLSSSLRKRLPTYSFIEPISFPHFQIDNGDITQTATTTTQNSVSGMKTFQPNRMIWSYLKRGKVALNQRNRNRMKEVFNASQINPSGKNPTGESQPPRNKIDVSAEIRIMFAYSPRKNRRKRHA
jgi:hypothetical protein